MTVGGRKMRYVAAQGPLAETTVDFWQMAWENQVNLIIMVTSECFQYWPPDDCKSSVQHGSFCVTSQYFTDSGTTITRRFCLTHSSSTEQRVVWHLEFVGWPDFGVPQCLSTFIAFINEIGSLRRQANSARGNDDTFKPPTVVHCIGGIGRTGVTILTELLLTAVQHNEPISIQHCLKLLRSQRMALVETPEQYRFVHQVLLDYLKHKKHLLYGHEAIIGMFLVFFWTCFLNVVHNMVIDLCNYMLAARKELGMSLQ
ncbi:tyrosine-protein phosphatase non-receptor type 14-like [Corticium candelabrum]|uniref:tyrosine-protein phosphatase non-receptor type 14-like n=1 Tax=Corticium candelabrum TaxID=121492 RepID=UPI002E268987|nr:tyrosine-protein phosphatase non-receptor type 14-like [Corticium candelabrum]